MNSANEAAQSRVVLAFREVLADDEADGRRRKLSEYVAMWPDFEEVIARELLGVASEDRDPEPLCELDTTTESVGPYRLGQELGRGGQGLVYKATDTRLNRTVALKVLTGLGPGAEKQLSRFRREAEVAARLEHPGICGVHDAGIEGGVPYIAMRYVEGETLAQRISRTSAVSVTDQVSGFLDFTDTDLGDTDGATVQLTSHTDTVMTKHQLDATLQVFEKAARALHVAHEAGIIHRDIKPGNIIVTDEGQPVILDFGLAHDDSEDVPSLTQTGDFFGTPAYMSPEQIAGQRIQLDARSDVYALGVTLYEALVLRRPYEAPTREALYQAIMTKEAPDPRKLNPSISKDLKVVLECVLEKDRDKRYATAEAFADDLAAVREFRPTAAKPIGTVGRTLRWAKRKPIRAALAAILIIGVPLVTLMAGFIWASLDDIRDQEEAKLIAEAEDEISEGFYSLMRQGADEAIEHFEKARDTQRLLAESAAGLALAHVRLKQAKPALNAILEAEEELQDSGVLLNIKADVLDLLERPDAARAAREAAPEPADSLAWFLEGLREFDRFLKVGERTKEGKEHVTRALGHFKRAVASSTRVRKAYLGRMAMAAARAGDAQTRYAIADALEALWPKDRGVWFRIGYCLTNLDNKRAEAAYRRCLEMGDGEKTALNNLGIILATEGRRAEALEMMKASLALSSGKARIRTLTNMASILRKLGRPDEAEAAVEEALKLGPEDTMALSAHANGLLAVGKHEEALAALDKAAEGKPLDALIEGNRSSLLHKLGRLEEAERVARAAIAINDEHNVAYLILAKILREKGRTAEAEFTLNQAQSRAPGDLEGHLKIAGYRMETGAVDKAISILQEAVAKNPRNVDARVNLATAYSTKRLFPKAIAELKSARAIKPDDALILSNLSGVYAQAGDTENAIKLAKEAIARNPNYLSAHHNLSSIYVRAQRWEEAEEAALEALAIDENSKTANENLWGAYWNTGRKKLALKKAQELVKRDPSYFRWHENLARALEDQGRLTEAEDAYRVALKAQPGVVAFRSNLSRLLVKQKRYEEALTEARAAIAIKPKFAEPHRHLGAALLSLGRTPGGISAIRDAIALDGGKAVDYSNLAFALRKLNRVEESVKALEQGAKLDPRNVTIQVELGKHWGQQRDFAKARAAFEKVIEVDPTNIAVLTILPTILMIQGEFERATSLAEKAYILSKEDVSKGGDSRRFLSRRQFVGATKQLALQLADEGKTQEADELVVGYIEDFPEISEFEDLLQVVAEAVNADHSSIKALRGKADRLLRAGSNKKAMELYTQILKKDPNDALALNQIAWLKVDPKGDKTLWDFEGAIPFARRMAEVTKRKNPNYLDTLAVALFRTGNLKEAVAVQEEILLLMKGKDSDSYTVKKAEELLKQYKAALKSQDSK